MTLRIGKANIGTDGRHITSSRSGNIFTISIAITANISIHQASLREQFRWAAYVQEVPQAGKPIYIDNSPFKTNTIYIDITNVYSGWAIPISPPRERNEGPGTVCFYDLDIFVIDNSDIQNYLVSLEAEDIMAGGSESEVSEPQCSNGAYVEYTPTTSYVKVLDIDNCHLPEGSYSITVHAYSETTTTVLFYVKVGSTTYTATGNSTADTWEIIPLGTPDLSGDDAIEIYVKDDSNTNKVRFDLIQFARETYTGQYRFRMDLEGLA
jgi:hypothetical protein